MVANGFFIVWIFCCSLSLGGFATGLQKWRAMGAASHSLSATLSFGEGWHRGRVVSNSDGDDGDDGESAFCLLSSSLIFSIISTSLKINCSIVGAFVEASAG